MDIEEVKNLIRRANRMGLRGVRVLDWIPPIKASEKPEGTFLVEQADESGDATQDFDYPTRKFDLPSRDYDTK